MGELLREDFPVADPMPEDILEFPVYNVMEYNPKEPKPPGCFARMVVVDFHRKVFENYGAMNRSYVLRSHSPYVCDKWSDSCLNLPS